MTPVAKIILGALAIGVVIAMMRMLFGPASVPRRRAADRGGGDGGGDTGLSWHAGPDSGHHGHHAGFGDAGHGGDGGGGDGGGGDSGGGGGDGGH